MRVGTRIGAGFLASLVVVATVASLSWRGAVDLTRVARSVEHTNDVQKQCDRVLEDLVDVETGVRGYVLTQESRFLEPTELGNARIAGDLAELRRLVEGDLAQSRLAERLQVVARVRIDFGRDVIDAVRQRGAPAATAMIASGRGKDAMDEARDIIDTLRLEEEHLLTRQLARAERRANDLLAVIGGAAVAVVVLLLVGTWILTRSITRPLAVLARAAQHLGHSNEVHEPAQRSDEIGDLARAFAEMTRLRDEAEARTRALIEQAPDAFFVANLDGQYIEVNEAACRLLGRRREEILGKTILDLIPQEDAPRLSASREELLRGGSETAEWRLRHRDGRYIPVEVSARILPDGRWQAFVRDISERQRHREDRERLLATEQEQRRRLEALREAVLAFSTLKYETAERTPAVLQSIVDQARTLVGADHAALGIGTDPEQPFAPWVWSGAPGEHVGPREAPRPVGLFGWVARHDETLRLDDRRRHPASVDPPPGCPPLEAFLGVPIRVGGRSVGNFYLAKRPGRPPFSAADQASVELLAGHAAVAIDNARLYDELQAAVTAREAMVAIVSHDLKNPLGAINLREQLLERDHQDPKIRAHVRSVRRSTATMLRMIRDLLDVASLDAGKLRLDVGVHPLGRVADEVIDTLAPLAADRGVRLVSSVPPGLLADVDPQRVGQVLANLVGNAIKFTGEEGCITIAAEERPDEVIVSVADTGVGIDPGMLPRVFDRYFTSERGHAGTGLGLHIARSLVEAHGGRIWVSSVAGQGSTFSFALPRRRPAVAPATA